MTPKMERKPGPYRVGGPQRGLGFILHAVAISQRGQESDKKVGDRQVGNGSRLDML